MLRRYEAAAYEIANEPETMEESDKEDSVPVVVLSELEQTENFIKENIEIDIDGNDDYSTSSEDEAQEDDKGER